MSTWDPTQYLRYGDERLRPFLDLVDHIGAPAPRRVVDLGCGPGNATVLLAERWPSAQVLGVDNSLAMIDRAQEGAHPPNVEFALGDAHGFHDPGALDVLLSNATLQWVNGHIGYFGGYIDSLVPGGWFAFQVPAMREAPSHASLYELARAPRWSDRLEGHVRDNWIEEPSTYLEALEDLGCTVDVWQTTYFHVLHGEDAVFEWMRGTSLRPFAEALEGEERAEFLDELRSQLRALYPRGRSGTVFPFHRLFVVAQRKAS